ncbi:MAG: response regulator transcription factor [Lachnospiraceae bacterium]|nr:response regulator transcription factor [Lachnospiraceae bacterium]
MDYLNRSILLVDDEEEILNILQVLLKKDGYQRIDTAPDCSHAFQKAEQNHPDLILLDVMLPDGNGFDLYRKLRGITRCPILFLSARDEDTDRIKGLGLGADDYVTKPFLSEELLLRIRNVLLRAYPPRENDVQELIHLGTVVIQFGDGTVTKEGVRTALTAKEFQLLKKLYENRGNIVTIDTLCNTLWDTENYGYENTLMVHIRHLREKIELDPSHPRYLITARGLGYKLVK